MQRYFTTEMPAGRFLLNTLIFSTLSLLPLLLLYVSLRPGFAAHLLQGGPALGRFLRQVLTNGLPVVFGVNYLSFFLLALVSNREKAPDNPLRLIVIDLLARLAIFILLHAGIYVLSAGWFGSFGGDQMTALRVVGPTLARSAFFENISGVYLYATLISALPLYVILIEQAVALRPDSRLARTIRPLPGRTGAVIAAFGAFCLFLIALTGTALAIASLLSG
ncbi:hypothetical protein [Tropicimonas marinistellae]|uniref:hypothetical protein n=1 Tax=Tropicimonas marinistellae TaxID=1739787 RepID=UPI0008312763|nr:hypothetical protein [Tropicimonas marinistellae]